jgi:hypothetical protein
MRIEGSRASEASVQEAPATSAVTSQRLANFASLVRSAQAAILPLELGQEIEARVAELPQLRESLQALGFCEVLLAGEGRCGR